MKRKPCGRWIVGTANQACTYDRMPAKQMCQWHWLAKQPADVQKLYAERRRGLHVGPQRARVSPDEWPDGERWCAGCQSFVPLFYCTGSRCKSCASSAAHAGAIERQYGLTGSEYDELFRLQGGVCYICHRAPRKKRLAVDHDHRTGQVRGLLCANNENGCNRAVVANLESAPGGGLAAARRLVEYLERPPAQRLRERLSDRDSRIEPNESDLAAETVEAEGLSRRPAPLPPPF